MRSMIEGSGSPAHGPTCVREIVAHVVALHCSGADGRQWHKLALALGPEFDCRAPDFYGCGSTGPWHGGGPFALTDEAAAVVAMIDGIGEPVHVVGHSYGGGVALRVAIERPAAIASLSLYEPSAFHLLKQLGGSRGAAALEEIRAVAEGISAGVVGGAYQTAAASFVDYWNGPGTWTALRPDVRGGLLRWLPKAPLDFRALLEERTPAVAYRRLNCPVLVLRGAQAPRPSRLIAEKLLHILPRSRLEIVPGAGHMGPLSHGEDVAVRVARHIHASIAGTPSAFSSSAAAGPAHGQSPSVECVLHQPFDGRDAHSTPPFVAPSAATAMARAA